jgi:hypothetical protein
MNYHIIAYSVYLPVTIILSIWTARRLHNNTQAFLMRKFNENTSLSTSTNNLIQTGFYLLALGFSFMYMKISPSLVYANGVSRIAGLENYQQTIEGLASKLGAFTFFIGVLLFFNFIIMLKIQSSPKQVTNAEEH